MVVQQFIYDPWGKQYNVHSNSIFSAYSSPGISRGYTGHKMVNDMDIIHMNGRIYDPTLGRFLQADPFIQFPKNSQSYNRYSYVLNNPLSYTDPSGYFLSGLSKKIGRKLIRSAAKIFGAKLVNMVGTAISTYFGSAFGAAAWTYEFNRAMGNSSSGSLRAAFTSFVAASLPVANTGNAFGNFVVDGVTGGSISYGSGGNFGHGFWAAGLNSAVGGGNISTNPYVNVISSVVIGGTISKITGGKFANGASSAAFSVALRQDWSSTPKEGSAAWDAREEAYFQAELAADQAMLASGGGYADNFDWRGENIQQCMATCINSNYGDLYELAGDFSLLSPPSVALNEWSKDLTERIKSDGTRKLYGESSKINNAGKRQLKTLRQFSKFTVVNGFVGSFALGFQAGAYGYCRVQCTF
jgi:RHS repeat-associated protein